jgi:itaconyl-CoA hydratase
LTAITRHARGTAHGSFGRFWEDLEQGEQLIGAGVTITDAHLVNWAGLTGDIVSLHLSEQYAAETQFKSRIAHGPLIMSLSLGLTTQTGYFGNVVAWLGVDAVRATKPTFVGDTIHPIATLVEARPTSRRGRGLWSFAYQAVNQRDEAVMTFTSSFLIARRDAA